MRKNPPWIGALDRRKLRGAKPSLYFKEVVP